MELLFTQDLNLRMIIIKPTSTTGNWQILDNKRPGFNESDNLAPK
jgi:hypothetical protein